MARKSMLERYNAHEAAAAGDVAPIGHAPTAVHLAAAGVLSELMSLGSQMSGKGDTPIYLRTMMRTLEKSRPLLLEGISGIPAESIKEFMTDLRDRINTIIDTPTDAETSADDPAGVRD